MIDHRFVVIYFSTMIPLTDFTTKAPAHSLTMQGEFIIKEQYSTNINTPQGLVHYSDDSSPEAGAGPSVSHLPQMKLDT